MPEQITEQEFREEVSAFLDANATVKDEEQKFVWGEGPDRAALFDEENREEELVQLKESQAWRAKRFDAGLGWISGPEEHGGRGLPPAFDRIYASMEARYEIPSMSFFTIGLGMVAPTILAHGTDTTKDAYLKKMWRGDTVGCQLFSEPGAGSDLASLQMRAERDGDEWILNGQKVWTSGAHYSDIGEVICRTDPDMPKHKGLTGFVVNMRAPGVEIRPLRQMTSPMSL
jgi:alkylation response protein AidB-like acyl-CoA dehydrogenase